MLAKILYKRPRLEAALSALDRGRLKLPTVNPRGLFDGFDQLPVTLTALPSGPWSSPLADVVTLVKIALSIKPRRVLEVGSYRGYTTKLLAEHTPPEAVVVAFDQDPRHGAAYRDSPIARKIERRVGTVTPGAFANDSRASYDLIFLDANHLYEEVKADTQVLLPLLTPNGVFVWHDYGNWGRFSRKNGVPEFLHEMAQSIPVAAVGGTLLAVHSPAWASGEGAKRLAAAREDGIRDTPLEDPWETGSLRG
jgi:predicted O-methyltransferase YrrM